MKILSKSDILNADDLKTVKVNVKEWGGVVCIRAMSAGEREAFERTMIAVHQDMKTAETISARLLSIVAVDDQGNRLFSEEDIGHLAKKNGGILVRLMQKARELNALSEGDIEDLAKN